MKSSLLVTLADNEYINQAKQLFSSAYFNAGWSGDYMLLAHKIPDKDLKCFSDKGILIRNYEGIFAEKDLKKLHDESIKNYEKEHLNIILDKFYLFTDEFKQWDNVVYLDSDIIVKSSLEELSGVEGFWAARDMGFKLKHQFIDNENRLLDELKNQYNLNKKSFNSGVMAFSTDIIQKNTFYELKNFINKYISITKFPDQCVLNLILYKKWKELNISYNALNVLKRISNKSVVHFAGQLKPWEKENFYYPEWEKNLENFDNINLEKPASNIKKIGKPEMRHNSLCFEIELLERSAHNFMGQTGTFLKNNFPWLFYLLKNKKRPNP